MKVAITVPDEIFDRAEVAASSRGMDRSQFYVRAAERYIAELESEHLVAAIDAVVDVADSDTSARFAVTAGAQLLDGRDDDW